MNAIEGRLPPVALPSRALPELDWPPYAIALGSAVVAGLALTQIGHPGIVVGLTFLCAAFVVAFWKFGTGAPLLFLLVALPLVPATEGTFPASLGADGRLLRAALLAGIVALATIVALGRVRRGALRTRPVVLALLALAAVGVVVAVANATSLSSAAAIAVSSAGQPAFYALALSALSAYAARGRAARANLLGAWCGAVVAEGLLVAFELASGNAYDPLRGVTRCQGTLGADFLGVFGMLGIFSGLALRESGTSGGQRRLGIWAAAAGAWLVVAAVARGGVVGTLIGIAYLLLRDQGERPRAARLVALCAALIALIAAAPARSIWEDGLGNRSLTSFDRPATWVSGARMARDHPLTGLGSTTQVEEALSASFDYRFTPYGETTSIPHNSLLLALVEGGVLYFAAALAALAVTVTTIRRRPRRRPEDDYLIAGLLGFAAVACVNNLFSHPELTVFALAAIAIVITPERTELRPGGLRGAARRGSIGG